MVGRRASVRAATRREIKAAARQVIADVGTAGLTLSAVSRRAGLSQPGLYRYYGGRDALLTELIADGYAELADAVEAAVVPDDTPAGQLVAAAHAYRAWAVSDPVGFGLVFGAPVPDYRAPTDGPTAAGGARVGAVFLGILVRAHAAGALDALPGVTDHGPPTAAALSDLPPAVVDRFLAGWGRLHGLVGLEVFGHLDAMLLDPAATYDRQVEALVAEGGLRAES